jgi:hypothetical protein
MLDHHAGNFGEASQDGVEAGSKLRGPRRRGGLIGLRLEPLGPVVASDQDARNAGHAPRIDR